MRVYIKAAAVVIALGAVAALPAAAQAPAGKPLKLSTSKPFGPAQSSTLIKDPAVDGQVLRVTVTQPNAKPWAAGMTSFIGEKVKAGDRIVVTLWLRVSQPETGKPAKVSATIQQSDAPRTEYIKKDFTLTDRWAPYRIEAAVPTDMPAYKVVVSLQIAHAQQTVDVASISAANLGPATGT